MFLGLKSSVIFILTVTIKKNSQNQLMNYITDYFLREQIPNDVYCWFVLIWEGASAAFFLNLLFR